MQVELIYISVAMATTDSLATGGIQYIAWPGVVWGYHNCHNFGWN